MHSLKAITAGVMSAGASWIAFSQCTSIKAKVQVDENVAVHKIPRVAVIGSGIGGSSATHFLRELLGPSAQIHVYEKSDKIGGRLSIVELDGHKIEAGGTIIHDSNKYMVNFTDILGLERFKALDIPGTLGIYDGKDFVFMKGDKVNFATIKMVWRYGPSSLWNLNKSLSKMLTDFQNIYTLQNDGKSFSTVHDMLRAMGGDYFVDYTTKTAEEVMLTNGIGKKLIDELVTGITRCNYGQDTLVNGFTGYVSMAGAQEGELFSVKNGNFQVCERLLERSNANVHLNHRVEMISKDIVNGQPKYYLENKDGKSEAYDAVVVAAPLEIPTCYFECKRCSNWPEKATLGRHQTTIATFVQAHINFKRFGFDRKEDMPTDVFTTENKDIPFSTIGMQLDITGKRIEPPLYKLFSRQNLSNETIQEYFEIDEKKGSKRVGVAWLAYPHYTPPEGFTSFVLDTGVFYVNAIERAASAMEMSAIGGRNAALLVKHYLSEETKYEEGIEKVNE